MKNSSCPVCRSEQLAPRNDRLRDADDVRVMECSTCTHVFLETFGHVNDAYFADDEFLRNKPGILEGVEERLRHYEYENQERSARVGPLCVNKRVLDYGCGAGQLTEKLVPLAKSIEGVERTASFRRRLEDRGLRVYNHISETPDAYDVILMFHVLEHLPEPVTVIEECLSKIKPGGLLYIEVPNVNDALISLYDVPAYRKFHFFRDHLHYFSRQSLTETFRQAGCRDVRVFGHNRFSLANHLYWLKHGKPGGHKVWSFLETENLREEYTAALAKADMSDSLVAQVNV